MKILFIYPNLMRQENIRLGIAYLSACLKKAGHKTSLIHISKATHKKKFLRLIKNHNPGCGRTNHPSG